MRCAVVVSVSHRGRCRSPSANARVCPWHRLMPALATFPARRTQLWLAAATMRYTCTPNPRRPNRVQSAHPALPPLRTSPHPPRTPSPVAHPIPTSALHRGYNLPNHLCILKSDPAPLSHKPSPPSALFTLPRRTLHLSFSHLLITSFSSTTTESDTVSINILRNG